MCTVINIINLSSVWQNVFEPDAHILCQDCTPCLCSVWNQHSGQAHLASLDFLLLGEKRFWNQEQCSKTMIAMLAKGSPVR